jgi:NarL family two-component system response regulator YdfI
LIRIVLVASSPTVRAGLRSMFAQDGEISILAEAADLASLFPDGPIPLPSGADLIVLVDSTFDPGPFNQIMEPLDTPFAVLLLSDDGRHAADLSSLPTSAWGLLSLDSDVDELLAAVHALYEGLLVAEPSLFEPLSQPLSSPAVEAELVETLTGREIEVLRLLAQGFANKQIASQLGISAHTVKFHLSSIYSKLDASNRAEAVTLGARFGLIPL